MLFAGKYFDGKSSVAYPAQIELRPDDIHITYTLADGTTAQINWPQENIHKNDLDSHGKVLLKYGEYPFQYIEVEDSGFATALKTAYPEANFHKGVYQFISGAGARGLALLVLAVIAISLLFYFVVVPEIAEQMAIRMPHKWEVELGNSAFESMISEEKIDTENSARLQHFFKKLHYEKSDEVNLYIINQSVVNAFALPGGKIIVYEGLLRKMDNYQQLAALLGHEYSHIELKHATRNLFRTLSGSLFISLLAGDAHGVGSFVLQNANQLKQLGYSRSLEKAADINGLKLMEANRIKPDGMAQLFEVLKKAEGGNEPVSFLSTHPLTTERIDYVNEEIKRGNYKTEENVQLDSLWKEIKRNLED